MSWLEDVHHTLAFTYIEYFSKDAEAVLYAIANHTIPHQTMLVLYNKFLNDKSIGTIESLPKDQKQKLFAEAKRLAKVQTKEHITNVCKGIYALNVILNK